MKTHQSLKPKISSLLMGLAAALATVGCATITTSSPNPLPATSAAVSAPVVAISYAQDQQQKLEQLEGLQAALQAYWQTHSQRNWAKLFAMELSPDVTLSENFYVAYHARAWPVLDVKVLSLKAENDTGADILLSQEVRYQNPDKNQPHVAYRHDKWRLVQGQWRHLVNDPMLLKPQ